MCAVMMLSANEVIRLTDGFENIYPVNFNCPGQIVVSGLKSEIEIFEEKVAMNGNVCRKIKNEKPCT